MSTAPTAEHTAVARDVEAAPPPQRRSTGALPLAAWVAGTVAVVVLVGLPHTRDWVFAWVLLGALALSVGNLGGWLRGVVVDWLPFFVVMSVYDLARGGA